MEIQNEVKGVTSNKRENQGKNEGKEQQNKEISK